MEHSIFHRLSRILWGFIVLLIVLLAVYVSVGRMLTSVVVSFQKEILQELNHRVPFLIDARQVAGQWHSFTPAVVMNGLRLTLPGDPDQSIDLAQGRIDLDVANSLLSWSPQMTHLHLEGLALSGELTADGQLRIKGLKGGDTRIGEWLEEFLLNVEQVALQGISLELTLPSGERRNFNLDLQLSREGSRRRIETRLLSTGGMQIFSLVEGVGNPFEPELFSGDSYLKLESADIGAVRDLLGDRAPDILVEGGIELELWSSWDKGSPTAELRVGGSDLLVSAVDQSWQLPFDAVAFEARLVERKKNWGLFIADLELARGGVNVQIPRLQLDAWGETLRIRATELPLEPLGAIVAGTDIISERAAEVLRILRPRGSLPSLQLSVADVGTPLEDWGMLANFQGVAVDSWKGAPGLTAANGYLELGPGGGYVVLDNQQFSMDFPTIYRQPLYYDDFHGTINIGWDSEAVKLSSGLVTAEGAEGVAQVLFGLNIPLLPTRVGLEMDLLVGLQHSHPIHRAKYVPDTLNENLVGWLESSIGDGVIEQGGFVWRGSLPPAAPELRTVQLFFNIEDTALGYHPDWPALAELDGVLLIDDSDVSVWSEEARLFESRINQLSVETWVNDSGGIMLAVAGGLEGPAADGLAVINGAVIGGYVGNVFADWQLSGSLDTQLNLVMDLTNKSVAPQVEVQTRWLDVDLDILPGNLPVRGINGQLNYSTQQGFSSSDLVGKLWGRPLKAAVEQRAAVAGTSSPPSAVIIDISSRADMRDVRKWLNLDMLALASGKTPVDIEIQVTPGEAPLLAIESSLAGLNLDLPSPWNKAAATRTPFRLDLQLGKEGMLIDLDLADDLQLKLDVVDGTLRAGSLAIAGAPAGLEAGALHISGYAPQVDVDEWSRFITAYFTGPEAVPAAVADAARTPEGEVTDAGLAIVVDKVRTDNLIIGGNQLGGAVVSMTNADGHWWGTADTDWLQGEFHLSSTQAPSRLDIGYLDLSGLAELQLTGGDGSRPLEFPDVQVSIAELHRDGRRLGNIAFDLRSEGEQLHVDNITGEVAGLQLLATQPGQLIWRQGEGGRTELQAALHFDDLGETLAEFGYQRILETKEGRFDLALEWPAGPQGFSLLQGQGSLHVDIGRGRFLDTPTAASGTLRVVSILNLAEIVRRLSLSHMFESGISFDRLNGEVFLHPGTIEVADIEVQGGASSFQFSGVSGVADQTLNGELVVTLPVASNLPWVAALTVGLPVAAGVFLLSKVFEDQVDRLTSAVYLTTGTWNDPQVKFDRIFDDTSRDGSTAVKGAAQSAEPVEPAAVEPAEVGPAPVTQSDES